MIKAILLQDIEVGITNIGLCNKFNSLIKINYCKLTKQVIYGILTNTITVYAANASNNIDNYQDPMPCLCCFGTLCLCIQCVWPSKDKDIQWDGGT